MTERITWKTRGLIKVRVEEPEPTRQPAEPAGLDLRRLISCPTCHARVTESCRTVSGTPRSPHTNRLTARLCPCGSLLEPRKQLCEWCRREARAETYARRERRAPTRERRKKAA